MVVHDLPRICGLNVPESKLETFSKTGSTFLVKRFDREGKQRIHFALAITLLGKTDGDGDTTLPEMNRGKRKRDPAWEQARPLFFWGSF